MILGTLNFIPETESRRLEKLHEYQILDTHSEDTFDNIALLASQIFGVPNAFISFVDEDRVFFKSNLSSLPFNEVDRKHSLCSLAILHNKVTVFNDTYKHPDLMDSPYVSDKDGIRFYAGAPLKSPEGYNMGTICVVDSVPREATDEQLSMLKTLSRIIIDKLENKLRYSKGIKSQINLMNIALHEIKNPLASISLANDILTKDSGMKDKMTIMIKSSVSRIQAKLTELLKQSEEDENNDTILAIEQVDLREVFTKILNNFELLASRKDQVIQLNCDDDLPRINADRAKISDVMHNLVSNAIKYSYRGATIGIIARKVDEMVQIEVHDEGQGLNDEDMKKLFTKFAKLSSKPTGKETSSGLGLSISKSFIELHNGTIKAISGGKDKGTSFIVSLPICYNKEEVVIQPLSNY
ncbi:GAF domain-containing sensor histidine kinase [Flavobacterium salilacus subsp. salilacus]|uniref:GAF domain-containing sensor histidine kinase n=1 Tax=Flavobacterium TaxID=237 RepID=UPI001074F97C|nr:MULTISPECIES: GAF domain-containing sensor histidine kinase [Flavobacterium]KAF2519200.1 GAF domain-containing sensor histidine kinase [Flavobacterium salilacus subsp. salilacus]MBE1613380.1 GAF domain-containing sensor histidine kinase [Flavobacterium sp. SaA2.13]NDI98887.1 GAF domain-containing sensor histidine kinase [Flavobacterium salilacus subsp. altitudinum]